MIQFPFFGKGKDPAGQLLRGFGSSAILHFLNILLTLGSGVLLARVLGVEAYGQYAFVISIITVISLPVKSGVPTLVLREVAQLQEVLRWGRIRGLLIWMNTMVFGYSSIAAALVFVVCVSALGVGDKSQNLYFWALLLLPLFGLDAVRIGALRGFGWIATSQLAEKIIRPAFVVSAVGLAVIFDQPVGTEGAIQFTVIGATIGLVIGSLVLKAATPSAVRESVPEYSARQWVRSLIPLTIFSGLVMLDTHVSIVLVGALASNEDVGLMKVAMTVATVVSFGLVAVNMALAPQVARLYKAGKLDEMQRMITLSARIVAITSFPVALTFILLGDDILSLVFGLEYAAAGPTLAVLAIGQLANTCAGSVALIVNMTGHERVAVVVAGFSVFAHIVLALLLIPLFGIIGAAVANAISMILWNGLLALFLRRKMNIKSYLKV